jgi:hypothetical protein
MFRKKKKIHRTMKMKNNEDEESSSSSRCKLEGGAAATDERRAGTWQIIGEGAKLERRWVDTGARRSYASLFMACSQGMIGSTESSSGGCKFKGALVGSRMWMVWGCQICTGVRQPNAALLTAGTPSVIGSTKSSSGWCKLLEGGTGSMPDRPPLKPHCSPSYLQMKSRYSSDSLAGDSVGCPGKLCKVEIGQRNVSPVIQRKERS